MGDSIVLLSLFILLVSALYISEHNLYKNDFSIFFYFVFIIITMQLTYTNNLLLMFIFFEFLFIPSLYFLYNCGYSRKVEKSVEIFLFWLLIGTFLALLSVVYMYYIFNTLNSNFILVSNFFLFEKRVLFFLLFIGFGVKLPVWPFYY
jgi:NADH-quinone oxidoreductase subunit M